jgi:tRNA (cytidine/uridine-2'-O-)-methyltransferase
MLRPPLHVALVHPEIHFNAGAAGRTCLGAGAQLHLVEPLGFSLDAAQVRRAGLDYWPRVAPRVWSEWAGFERTLPELGEPYLFSTDGERTLWDVSYPDRVVLIFGRESVGLEPEIRERHRDRLLRIPMSDPALRSLNLATTVALGLYEVLRQWRER